MCNYCENEAVLMQESVISPAMLQWVGGIKPSDACNFEYPLGVLIDSRGYLRLANLDDCQCLDHGEKIKISFCPFCGGKFDHADEVR